MSSQITSLRKDKGSFAYRVSPNYLQCIVQTWINKVQNNNFLGALRSPIFITDNHRGLGWGVRNESDIDLVEDISVRHTILLVKCVYGMEWFKFVYLALFIF